MDLVIDANVVIFALIAPEGKTRAVIFLDTVRCFAPEFLMEECKKHKVRLLRKQNFIKKTELSEDNVDEALLLLASKIRFIPFQEFKSYLQQAQNICNDPNDVEYIAVALAKKMPLWTDDKQLHKQTVVKVYGTAELLKGLGLS